MKFKIKLNKISSYIVIILNYLFIIILKMINHKNVNKCGDNDFFSKLWIICFL